MQKMDTLREFHDAGVGKTLVLAEFYTQYITPTKMAVSEITQGRDYGSPAGQQSVIRVAQDALILNP